MNQSEAIHKAFDVAIETVMGMIVFGTVGMSVGLTVSVAVDGAVRDELSQ